MEELPLPPHLLNLTAQYLKVCGIKILGKGDGHLSLTYGTCCPVHYNEDIPLGLLITHRETHPGFLHP